MSQWNKEHKKLRTIDHGFFDPLKSRGYFSAHVNQLFVAKIAVTFAVEW
jgi:hypothetical protein